MRVLIVDDEQEIRERVAQILQFEQFEVLSAQNGLSAQRLLEQEVVTAVVTDFNMPGMDGLELLKWIKEEGPLVPVMVMSAYGGISDAVEAMKAGAEDYIVKPFHTDEFLLRLRRIIDNRKQQDLMAAGRNRSEALQGWIGESPAIQEIEALLDKVAPTVSTVLIAGESGTGKEVVARMIHRLSPRADNPFVAVNIGGVPENLLESELFGYEKGAFTGANARKLGMFELASSGTLFLDEIGDMPMHLQVKLLRVLQERKIQRLGGTRALPIDVRILSATNKNLEKQITQNLFREDLFYRLKVIRITLPPLRKRREDLPLLVGHFIQRYNAMFGKSVQGMEPEALDALQSYRFPGNIRELENIIERAMILADADTIALNDLEAFPTPPKTPVRKGTLDDIQKQAIRDALLRWEGNRTKAAEELGVSRQTIITKIRDYGIEAI